LDREQLEKRIHSLFSDTLMMFLAILVIPLIMVQFCNLTPVQETIVICIDWFIYTMFLLEFVLKVAVAENKIGYIKDNKSDSIISLIIIISPIFELFAIFFMAAPLLRLLRISRLVRLGGIIGKTEKEWKRVNLKSYTIVIVIISFGIILSFFKPNIGYSADDALWLSIFISVIGIIYALIAAFMIVNVWGEFDKLENLLRKETISLRNLYIIAFHMNSQITTTYLKRTILDYIKVIREVFWQETKKLEDAESKFIEIFQSLKEFDPKNGKEEIILNNLYEEMRTTSSYRVDVVTLIEAKTPGVLWILLTILSFIVILGFYIVNFENQLIATLIITMVATSTAVVIIIIYDIDYPFRTGFWQIEPDVYNELEEYINHAQ